jgi:integrase
MGKRAEFSGVRAKGSDRIEFEFWYEGVRYRPTLLRNPTEANLRRAHKQLVGIKARIKTGTFQFEEEFPDYRFKGSLPNASSGRQSEVQKELETCDLVFNRFLAYCELRVSKDDMALSTLKSYREIIDRVFRPEIGGEPFEKIVYSRLAEVVAHNTRKCKKKTYNNITSAVRTAFKFGYKDFPERPNPALALPSFRITAKDRPKVDPFTIQDAEAIIFASHRLHGEWYGNYEEFRFFTGLRQSEEFALQLEDCDLATGKIVVTKAVVEEEMKNRTKTNQDREITLCARALQVLKAQIELRNQLVSEGHIKHNFIFFSAVGEPLETTYLPYNRWTEVLETLPVRFRKPYNARHSYTSWRLMVGHNRLLVAYEDGHSLATMERTYAAWAKGAQPDDIELIKKAMAGRPTNYDSNDQNGRHHRRRYRHAPPESPKAATTLPLGRRNRALRLLVCAVQASCARVLSACSCIRNRPTSELAGVEGFEPPNGGIKTRCLTTWRHPNIQTQSARVAPCQQQLMHGRHIQRPRHVTSPAVGHLRRDAFRVNRGGA